MRHRLFILDVFKEYSGGLGPETAGGRDFTRRPDAVAEDARRRC
jgi:hypothetical protein